MDRRNFVTRVLLTGGAFGLGFGCNRKLESSPEQEVTAKQSSARHPGIITEPAPT